MAQIKRGLSKFVFKDRNLQRFVDAVTENINSWRGDKGSPKDRVVTVGDLTDLGVAKLGGGGSSSGGLLPGDFLPSLPDMTVPPAPTGFTATGAWSNVILDWDAAPFSNYAYTQVWRSETDDLGTAVQVGTSVGNVYTDSLSTGQTVYYWIRFVSTSDVVGPYNATAGSVAYTALVATQNMAASITPVELLGSLTLDSDPTNFDGRVAFVNDLLYKYLGVPGAGGAWISATNWAWINGAGTPEDYATYGADWNASLINAPYSQVYSADDANLLGVNPVFGDWTGAYPAGWGGYTPIKETTTVKTGRYAVRYNTDGVNEWLLSFMSDPFPNGLPVGTYVRGSFSYYLPSYTSGGGGAGLIVDLYTTTNPTVPYTRNSFLLDSTATGEWHRQEFIATVAPGDQIFKVRIILVGSYAFEAFSGPSNLQIIFDHLEFDFVYSDWATVVGAGKPDDNATVGGLLSHAPTWVNQTNTTTENDNHDIAKATGAVDTWDCSASSAAQQDSGDCIVQGTVSGAGYRMIGLWNGSFSTAYATADFAMYAHLTYYVYESGVSKFSSGISIADGDVMAVRVKNGAVQYLLNGVVIYTSLTSPTYPLKAGVWFYTLYSWLRDVWWSAGTNVSGAAQYGQLAPGTVGVNELLANSVVAGKIAVGAINAGDAVISNAAIENAQIANLAVDNAKIANLAVTELKLANLAVTAAKIANATITQAKIGSAAIGTAQIIDANITTLKVAGNAITVPVSVNDASGHGTAISTIPTWTLVCQTSAWTTGGGDIHLDFSVVLASLSTSTVYYQVKVERWINGVYHTLIWNPGTLEENFTNSGGYHKVMNTSRSDILGSGYLVHYRAYIGIVSGGASMTYEKGHLFAIETKR